VIDDFFFSLNLAFMEFDIYKDTPIVIEFSFDRKKTAGMLEAMCFVGALLEQNTSEFIEWLAAISIFYQH
jgi:hypothetical protein